MEPVRESVCDSITAEAGILRQHQGVLIVWEIVRINANEVRLGIGGETNGTNVAFALNQRLQDAMHSIHDAAVT